MARQGRECLRRRRPATQARNRRVLQPPVPQKAASARSACVTDRSIQLRNFSQTSSKPYRRIGRRYYGIFTTFYRGPSNRNPKGRNKKAGPGHRLGLVQKPSICGSAFFDFKKTFAIFAREHGAEAVICFNRWAPSERFELGRIDDQITGHSLP
jgi:hypothetical protein